MMSGALAWSMGHDPGTALRMAQALRPWWQIRGRLTGQVRLLATVAEHAAPGSDEWCTARLGLGQAAGQSGDAVAALEHFTAVRDALEDAMRPASRGRSAILSLCLGGRAGTLSAMGRAAEAVDDARRALELARETGLPGLQALALACLSVATWHGGDRDGAFLLARRAQQLPGDVAGALQRGVSQLITMVLAEAGDMAAAERACAAGLAWSREAGDLTALAGQLRNRVMLDLRSRRVGEAAAHLRDATMKRMIPLLGLPPDATPETVAERTAHQDAAQILTGPAPDNDAALVALADKLDALERKAGAR